MANEAAEQALSISFSKGSDIPDFFSRTTGKEFIGWFNANCANKDAWKGKALGTSDQVRQRFNLIWDQFPLMFGTENISLAQFISLTSIFINEVGADLLPITEKVGRANHPGLAYPFNAIKDVKISYNQSPNKTAFELFNNGLYIQTHGDLALADRLKNTTDQRWNAMVYPQADFTTTTDVAASGFLREADFFKFRGRGFIQTTWRSNYILLIKFIQAYAGTNPKVLSYKAKWAGLKPDDVATISTNVDWDDLFQNSDLVIPCAGVKCHNQASGNYLNLSKDVNAVIGKGPGSINRMGLKISGGTKYANLFRARVIQTMLTLSKQM
jgi:hypothetical protein